MDLKEHYRMVLAKYEMQQNDAEAYEDVLSASDERLLLWALRDAIKYWNSWDEKWQED